MKCFGNIWYKVNYNTEDESKCLTDAHQGETMTSDSIKRIEMLLPSSPFQEYLADNPGIVVTPFSGEPIGQ